MTQLTRERITGAMFDVIIAQPENIDRRLELIDGAIVEKAMPTREHGHIAARLTQYLFNYFDAHPELGGDVAVEARHRPTGDDSNDRLPDVSVVLGNKPIAKKGVTDYLPDICIEVKSPDDRLTAMRYKAFFYLDNGTRAAVIVIADLQSVEIYTADEAVTVLTIDDTLTFPNILPGFAVPVAKFLPPAQAPA